MANQHRLQDPKFIKLLALTTSILAVSIVSIGFIARAASGRENSSPSAGAVPGGSDGSRKLMEGWDSNGWSSGEWPSKMSKCGKSGGGSSGWSAGKSGKSRRLGESWASVWGPPSWDNDEEGSNWQPSSSADWGGSWDDDDDCGWSTDESHSNKVVFVKDGKSAKSKSSKSKSAKSKSSKSTSTTNDWSSPWTWNPPSKTTDSADTWSSPWTPPSEPWWGSSSWKATPAPTPGDEPTWRSSTWKASPKPTTEDKPTWGSSAWSSTPTYYPTSSLAPTPEPPTVEPTSSPAPTTDEPTSSPAPTPEPSPKTEVQTDEPTTPPITDEPTTPPSTDEPTSPPSTDEPTSPPSTDEPETQQTDAPTPCGTSPTSSPTCPTPSPVETESTTPMPTACEERLWYFNSGSCTNGYDMPIDNDMYLTLVECCETNGMPGECTFNDVCNPSPPPTPEPTPEPSLEESTTPMPTACEERLWYFNSGSCTNGYDMSIDNDMYPTLVLCCEMNEMPGECTFNDVCNPSPPPTPGLEVVTYTPTFGSTPTVSKETTGPPTQTRNNA